VALHIVFCGTPEFAVPSLKRLIADRDFEVAGVVTQPDRPSGRGKKIHGSPVKQVAVAAGIPVYQPGKIKSDEGYDYFRCIAPDAVVIIAYGQIISPRLIAVPRLGWINLHASLLPKYRGAAPINWAIVNGETRTGLTTMQIDAGLDTGPILLKYETEIGADETAPELTARLAEAGAPLILEALRKLASGEITPIPQDNSQATSAPPLKKEDGRIDWSLAATQIYARIRGLQPWPGAFTSFRGKRCQIWARPVVNPAEMDHVKQFATSPFGGTIVALDHNLLIACGRDTALRLEFAQMEGRKRVTSREFALGVRRTSGDRFGG
jgi:methionyl-tRNA formyltransferase